MEHFAGDKKGTLDKGQESARRKSRAKTWQETSKKLVALFVTLDLLTEIVNPEAPAYRLLEAIWCKRTTELRDQ